MIHLPALGPLFADVSFVSVSQTLGGEGKAARMVEGVARVQSLGALINSYRIAGLVVHLANHFLAFSCFGES